MQTPRSDALIIGGGLAGIAAALELLDRGARVLILDRDAEESFGGLARESFGGIFVVGSDEQKRAKLHDSPELALADWLSFGELTDADVWPKRWAEAYVHRCREDVYRWLKERGLRFVPMPLWAERGESRRGNSLPRFHLAWGTGREIVNVLLRRLEAHPQRDKLTLRFGHRVERLVTANGAVTGAAGVREADGTPFEAHASCVLVATGGVGGSQDIMRRHWHADWRSPPAVLLNGSHRYADGRLHDAARAAGAQVTHLDRMWNYASGVHHPRPRKPEHGLSLVPPRSALWLDWQGRRLDPPLVSGFDTRALVTRVCATERQYSWHLMNRRIALKELAISGAEFNPAVREHRKLAFLRDVLFGNRWLVNEMTRDFPDVLVAGSLEGLAAKMNALAGDDSVRVEALRESAARYDAELDLAPAARRDAQLRSIAEMRASWRGDRLRLCDGQKILDPRAAPLIAIRMFVISRKTLGGIQTDLQCRALGASGEPVGGLYAAGEAAGFGGGGMHGLRALEGTFLGGCVLTGRIAGQAIARALAG
jgi:predicted oxidoreductase